MDGDGEELRIWAFPHSLNATENGEQNVQVGGKCMNHMNHRSFGLVNSKFLQLCHSLDLWLLCSRHEVADTPRPKWFFGIRHPGSHAAFRCGKSLGHHDQGNIFWECTSCALLRCSSICCCVPSFSVVSLESMSFSFLGARAVGDPDLKRMRPIMVFSSWEVLLQHSFRC